MYAANASRHIGIRDMRQHKQLLHRPDFGWRTLSLQAAAANWQLADQLQAPG